MLLAKNFNLKAPFRDIPKTIRGDFKKSPQYPHQILYVSDGTRREQALHLAGEGLFSV
jgi:hypothetical protein